jgi:hypothetical protein
MLPAAVVELASCSSDPAATPTAPADASSEQRPAPVTDAAVDDAEAAARPPPPSLPGCVGPSLPLVQSGERAYISVNLGGSDGGVDAGAITGDFLLDFGANGSTIDLKAFAPPPPAPASCLGDAGAPGAICYFPNFDFFGPWGTVALVTGDYSFLINSVRQAGIIGTDFLSVAPFTLEYTNARIEKGSTSAFCTDTQLLGAGLVPIPTGGYYTNKPATLRPLSEVVTDPDASVAGYSVPNIPTVPITVAGVSALAQLDTGFDDRIIRHSVNINQALLDRLMLTSPDKLTRRALKDLFLTTCVPGLSQRGSAYELAPGTSVNFVTGGGAVGRADTGTFLFVKERLPDAERCGGIETWTVPAAQMGASFLTDAQTVIFDPITSRVWLPKN